MPHFNFLLFLLTGAALGRIIGEGMHLWFPNGVRYGGKCKLNEVQIM